MARYIDADDFMTYLGIASEEAKEENIGEIITAEDVERYITFFAETADVKPIVRGLWMVDNPYSCSVCECVSEHRYIYCPVCGAEMKSSYEDADSNG